MLRKIYGKKEGLICADCSLHNSSNPLKISMIFFYYYYYSPCSLVMQMLLTWEDLRLDSVV